MVQLAAFVSSFLVSMVAASSANNADAPELSLVQLRAETLRGSSAPEMEYDSEDDDWVPDSLQAAQPSPLDLRATEMSEGVFATDDMTAFGSVKSRKSGSIVVGFGFQKCATTFVSTILRDPEHNVNSHTKKELHYIARRDPTEASAHHTKRTDLKPSHCAKTSKSNADVTLDSYIDDCFGRYPKPNEVTFDFTPDYAAPENVNDFVKSAAGMVQPARQHNAEMRFFAMLRNPADRAISELDMKRKHGSLTATDTEMDQMMLNHARTASLRYDSFQLKTAPWNGYPPMMTFGEYNQSLAVILKELPKESVLLVNSAKLSEQVVWKRIYAHVGLDMPPAEKFTKMFDRNSRAGQKNSERQYVAASTEKWKPSDKVTKALEDYYKPFNLQLWKLIGTKWW